jgi:predicted DNA-binding transcriptional regulator AlpA
MMTDNTPQLMLPERLPDLGIDYSDMQRRRLEAAGKFPRRVKLSERKHSYVADEIMAWIRQRLTERDGRAA